MKRAGGLVCVALASAACANPASTDTGAAMGDSGGSTSGDSSSGSAADSSGSGSSSGSGGSSGADAGGPSGNSTDAGDGGTCDGTGPLPWPQANAIVCDVQNHLPRIPDHTCTVTDLAYGAKGDGTTDDTMAFAKAIAACEAMSGGHVDVPAGKYSTGAIHLDNNIDLHFETGATILFNGNVAEYPTVQTRYQGTGIMNHSPMVYAYQKHDISVTGPGVLDAVASPNFATRVNFFEPYSCTSVLIKDITLVHSHFWQFHPTLVT